MNVDDERRLFDADPQFRAAASAQAVASLRRESVTLTTLRPGRFEPGRYAARDSLGLVIISGLLARTVTVPGGNSLELVSSGHILQPWTVEQPSFADVTWAVLEELSFYEVDRRLSGRIAEHQELLIELLARGIRRAHVLTIAGAIESVVGIENRVLLALWHLAELCGHVESNGVTMPLPLTHELLATIVGSRRPSVTSALAVLTERGLIARRPDRGWLLLGDCPDLERESMPTADSLQRAAS